MTSSMKKLTALLLSSALVLTSLSACGKRNNEPETSTAETTTEASTEVEKSTVPEETTTEETSTEEETTVPETTEAEKLLSAYANPFLAISESLNVRKEPSTEAQIIATMSQYAGGEILDETADGQWLHITSGEVEGYVFKENTVSGEEAERQADGHVIDTVTVTVDAVNIRDGASTEANVIDSAAHGVSFVMVGEENDFYKIALNSGTAYISKTCASFCRTLNAAVPTAPEPEKDDPSNNGYVINPGNPAAVVPSTNGYTVCIDPGHQQHGISEQEPNGPGSSVMKAKLTTGTSGCVTGNVEYQVNLDVSLKLQAELVSRGYGVVMIRTTNDCPLSNAERAQVANASGAQVFVRVHCNSLDNSAVTGIINYAPSAANPYLNADLVNKSNSLAALLADRMCARTGAQNRGVLQDDGMTGINWCTIPVAIVEMGFMSNPTEDQLLGDPAYQTKLALGMADGIDAYFGR